MTLEKIRIMFNALANSTALSLQLLQIKTSKSSGSSYFGREITLAPEGKLTTFVEEISDSYINESQGILSSYSDVRKYDGSTVNNVVYSLSKSDELIASEYDALIDAISFPDSEVDPLKFKANAYVLKGIINIDNEDKPIELISMKTPITTLRNKYLSINGAFQEITDKVITLRPAIDVIIMEDTVYMLTLAGENLFNIERAYKKTCEKKLKEINDCKIVNDFKNFSSVASSGQNPRKFLSFNDEYLQKLKNKETRDEMAKKFTIPMDGDLFDTTEKYAADRIIKLLCGRGMLEPFKDTPMEVAGSKKWE